MNEARLKEIRRELLDQHDHSFYFFALGATRVEDERNVSSSIESGRFDTFTDLLFLIMRTSSTTITACRDQLDNNNVYGTNLIKDVETLHDLTNEYLAKVSEAFPHVVTSRSPNAPR